MERKRLEKALLGMTLSKGSGSRLLPTLSIGYLHLQTEKNAYT